MIDQLQGMTKSAGRDPADLEVIVRANLYLAPQPLGEDRWIFSGTLDQIKADIAAVKALQVSELLFDPLFSQGVTAAAAFLTCMQQMRELV